MVTTQEHLNNLVVAAFHRELEIYQYQINIDNYTVMLAALPQEDWSDALAQYKGAAIDSLPSSLDETVITQIADFQYRDRLRNLLRTERVECGRAGKIRDALKTQIGVDYESLLAAYKASQQT